MPVSGWEGAPRQPAPTAQCWPLLVWQMCWGRTSWRGPAYNRCSCPLELEPFPASPPLQVIPVPVDCVRCAQHATPQHVRLSVCWFGQGADYFWWFQLLSTAVDVMSFEKGSPVCPLHPLNLLASAACWSAQAWHGFKEITPGTPEHKQEFGARWTFGGYCTLVARKKSPGSP